MNFIIDCLKSKTYQGILAMTLAALANRYLSAEFSEAEMRMLTDILTQLGVALGSAWAFYGRVNAKGPIGSARNRQFNSSILPLIVLALLLAGCAGKEKYTVALAALASCRAYTFTMFELANLRLNSQLTVEEIETVNHWRPILNSFCDGPAPPVDTKATDLLTRGVKALLEIELAAKQGRVG